MMLAQLPVAVHIFFHQEGKLLLVKRINTGFQDNTWSVPAGRVDEHESITAAAVREAQEEVGVVIDRTALGQPLIMHNHDARGEQLYFFSLLCLARRIAEHGAG